jgi:hypothetical protein
MMRRIGKIIILNLIILYLIVPSASSMELICNGMRSRDSSQKIISVDCTDKNAVVSALNIGWIALKNKNYPRNIEDMCFNPFKMARDAHPSLRFDANYVFPSLFEQCNMALLKYVE